MNELIKIQTSKGGKQVVSARDLHAFLNAGSNPGTWFKNQIERCMLVEGVDFIQLSELSTGGRPSIDYVMTLSAAKELAMVNGGDKGKEARLYFIECEKRANVTSYNLPVTYADALRQLAEKVEEKEAMQKQLEAQKPAVEFFEAVTNSADTMDMLAVSKVLGIGRTKLFDFLRLEKILMKGNDSLPYQQYIDQGYFKVIEQSFTRGEKVGINKKVLVYQKGVDFIYKRLKKFNK